MKIKLINGEELEIKLKGRHTTKIMKTYAQMTSDKTDVGDSLTLYTEELDKIASEATGKSIDELEDMDAEDKNIILNKIQEVALSRMDFLKSSLALASSVPKTK
jgi:hypothetical protein